MSNANESSTFETMHFLVDNRVLMMEDALSSVICYLSTEQLGTAVGRAISEQIAAEKLRYLSGHNLKDTVLGCLDDATLLEAVCRFIDAEHLADDFEKWRNYNRYLKSPALTLLTSTVRHDDETGFYLQRELLFKFVERTDNNAILRIISEWLDENGSDLCPFREWEEWLQTGIALDYHNHLEDRLWMTSRHIRYYSEYMTDIAMSENEAMDVQENVCDEPQHMKPWLASDLSILPRSEFSEMIDDEELYEPEDDYVLGTKAKRMPLQGSPTSLKGRTVFESLMSLYESDVCSKAAIYGQLASILDPEYNEKLRDVLCQYIDKKAELSEFGEYISQELAMRNAIQLDSQFAVDWPSEGF